MTASRFAVRLTIILVALAAVAGIQPPPAYAAATIVILNVNAAGVGFNDPTPVAPVGGNPGTTLGEQRLFAFQAAANIWGASLDSTVPILIRASFEPLTCSASSAVLGSAGATFVFRDFPGAPFANTWYHYALANKRAGMDLDPVTPANPQMTARFNVNLGQTGCLTGTGWYLGVDGNHGASIDLVAVLLHEFAHGLGFSNITSGTTGAFAAGYPSSWDRFVYDNSTAKTWFDMTAPERVASAINPRNVAWTGADVTASAPLVLSPGTPMLSVSAPASVAGGYSVGSAGFGPVLSAPGVTRDIMPVVLQPGNTGPGCEPFNAINTLAVAGNIALIDRGVCGFTVKVKNAQNAGAVGVIIADNVAGGPPAGLGGADPTITIPSVRITLADATTLRNALKFRSRTRSGVIGNLGVDINRLAGADALGRVLLFTPNPFQSGSSVSHFDTIAFPNLLMEPNINSDLTHFVVSPWDLTLNLLRDIGW